MFKCLFKTKKSKRLDTIRKVVKDEVDKNKEIRQKAHEALDQLGAACEASDILQGRIKL